MNTLLKKSLLPLIVIALLGLIGWQLNHKSSAPEVTFTTLHGKQISMHALQNKVVLVNFWATDCPGCIQEMPDLINTYHAYQAKGFEVIAVAMSYDLAEQVHNYNTTQKLPFLVTHDISGEISQKFGGVNLTPTAFIFNKKGEMIQRTMGTLDFAKLHQLLDQELSS
ncbi:MAG: TlpA family protein disulfide reductase [Methylotenera sp.]|nr:TlpA family protein disulfide reductase [Methylotenera sp.]